MVLATRELRKKALKSELRGTIAVITILVKSIGRGKVLYQEQVSSRSEAVKRERFLKSGVGRQELKKILANCR